MKVADHGYMSAQDESLLAPAQSLLESPTELLRSQGVDEESFPLFHGLDGLKFQHPQSLCDRCCACDPVLAIGVLALLVVGVSIPILC